MVISPEYVRLQEMLWQGGVAGREGKGKDRHYSRKATEYSETGVTKNR
jgi:hypothetical protein